LVLRRCTADNDRLNGKGQVRRDCRRQNLLRGVNYFCRAVDLIVAAHLRSGQPSTSRSLPGTAGFQVSINGRFWVSTEVLRA
jgi:hypothetical protein